MAIQIPDDPKTYPATVKEKTGKSWEEWIRFLDKGKCDKMNHKEIVAYIHTQLQIGGWWEQMVTVAYEKFRGMREDYQTTSGYQVSASKTMNHDSVKVFDWMMDADFRKQLMKKSLTVSGSRKPDVIRLQPAKGKARLELRITGKGKGKCTAIFSWTKLESQESVEKERAHLKDVLSRLAEKTA